MTGEAFDQDAKNQGKDIAVHIYVKRRHENSPVFLASTLANTRGGGGFNYTIPESERRPGYRFHVYAINFPSNQNNREVRNSPQTYSTPNVNESKSNLTEEFVRGGIDSVTSKGSNRYIIKGWACIERRSDPVHIIAHTNQETNLGEGYTTLSSQNRIIDNERCLNGKDGGGKPRHPTNKFSFEIRSNPNTSLNKENVKIWVVAPSDYRNTGQGLTPTWSREHYESTR